MPDLYYVNSNATKNKTEWKRKKERKRKKKGRESQIYTDVLSCQEE